MVNRITKKELNALGIKKGSKIKVFAGTYENSEDTEECEIESIFCGSDGCTVSINVPDGSGQASVDCVVNGIWYDSEDI